MSVFPSEVVNLIERKAYVPPEKAWTDCIIPHIFDNRHNSEDGLVEECGNLVCKETQHFAHPKPASWTSIAQYSSSSFCLTALKRTCRSMKFIIALGTSGDIYDTYRFGFNTQWDKYAVPPYY